MVSLLLPMLLVVAQEPTRAAAAADRFALDLPASDAAAAAPDPAATAPVEGGAFSLDTPIADLIADPKAKAILDRDLPGLSDDENLPKFKALSLRKLAPLSGGQMTPALLAKVGGDLAALGGSAPPPVKPVESRRGLPSGR
ncbi:hypothetical protein [Sphingomonas sp. CLY1604]|uniref:hypothetical protein n=1 Tax=Sphingomonas sp. CLY1604 TaxID=3457786 RepID=UPI003FD8EF5C